MTCLGVGLHCRVGQGFNAGFDCPLLFGGNDLHQILEFPGDIEIDTHLHRWRSYLANEGLSRLLCQLEVRLEGLQVCPDRQAMVCLQLPQQQGLVRSADQFLQLVQELGRIGSRKITPEQGNQHLDRLPMKVVPAFLRKS